MLLIPKRYVLEWLVFYHCLQLASARCCLKVLYVFFTFFLWRLLHNAVDVLWRYTPMFHAGETSGQLVLIHCHSETGWTLLRG